MDPSQAHTHLAMLGLILLVGLASSASISTLDPCDREDANGCSSPFDFPFKKEFTPSCNRHDICYGCVRSGIQPFIHETHGSMHSVKRYDAQRKTIFRCELNLDSRLCAVLSNVLFAGILVVRQKLTSYSVVHTTLKLYLAASYVTTCAFHNIARGRPLGFGLRLNYYSVVHTTLDLI